MSSKRASVNPLAGFLKPQSPAERLTAQHRDREKLQRERQLKELQEEEAKARGRSSRGRGKRKGRGCDEEARWAPMLLAPRASLLLSQPLQTLPLGHPHRVSEDAKRVASLIEECTKLSFSPCRQWSACTAACTAAAAAGAGGQAQESKPQPQPQPQPLLQTVHKQHWALELKNYFPTGPSRSALELEN
jgi:hypothetical protein